MRNSPTLLTPYFFFDETTRFDCIVMGGVVDMTGNAFLILREKLVKHSQLFGCPINAEQNTSRP